MRRTILAGGLGGVVLLAGLVVLHGQPPGAPVPRAPEAAREPHTLRTSGSASVRVKPDAARVFFGVQTMAATIHDARTQNNDRIRKILAALTDLKIPDLKSKTSDVQVEILYGHNNGNHMPPITGYRVTTTFTVLVQDEDQGKLGVEAGRILDAALEAGANSVQQITFLKKGGLADAQRKALTQAVEDALENARALSAGAKKGQLETVTIDGQPTYRELPYFGHRNQMVQSTNVAIPQGPGGEAALVVGDLEVTCQVNVSCTF